VEDDVKTFLVHAVTEALHKILEFNMGASVHPQSSFKDSQAVLVAISNIAKTDDSL